MPADAARTDPNRFRKIERTPVRTDAVRRYSGSEKGRLVVMRVTVRIWEV